MNFRRTTWGVGLLGALALLGCGGDDTPTPNGLEGEAGITGAGGTGGNDASAVGTGGSAGKAGGSATDSGGDGAICKKTAAMAMTSADMMACKATLPETGASSEDGGSSCLACLCGTCPFEAKNCGGDPDCKAVTGDSGALPNDCCRAACKACAPPAMPEAGSDGSASEASTSDSPARDAAAE